MVPKRQLRPLVVVVVAGYSTKLARSIELLAVIGRVRRHASIGGVEGSVLLIVDLDAPASSCPHLEPTA